MKTVLYFILAILSVVYVACMCVFNVVSDVSSLGSWGTLLEYIRDYGGVVLIFAFAAVNFFGSPLKAVFFTILILVAVAYVVTLFIPAI